MNHKILSRSTAALALALLAGCGGGGGGTSAGGSPPPGSSSGGTPQPPGFTVGSGGTAGKGIITGATVDALEVTATGLVSRGQSTTGGDGGFNVQLSRYTGGPILYRLRGGAGAQMKCDVRAGCVSAAGTPVAFGSFFALADSFVMEGISPGVAQAATLTACLSPLTHLAASRARELAGGVYENINTDQAKRALIELRLLTGGIDVGRSCVIDLTDPAQVAGASPELLAHAFYAAAALASTPDGNPTNALARLTQAFQGGVIAATDTDPARLSLAELANAAANEATAGAIPLPDSIQLLQMTAEQAAGTGNQVRPCSSEPCGGTPAQVSASEKARAVFGELRSLFRNGERELTDPAAAFAEQIEAAAMAASPSAQQLGQGLGSGAQQAVEFYFSNNMTAGSETLDSTDSSGTARTATVTIANNADGSRSKNVRNDAQKICHHALYRRQQAVELQGVEHGWQEHQQCEPEPCLSQLSRQWSGGSGLRQARSD